MSIVIRKERDETTDAQMISTDQIILIATGKIPVGEMIALNLEADQMIAIIIDPMIDIGHVPEDVPMMGTDLARGQGRTTSVVKTVQIDATELHREIGEVIAIGHIPEMVEKIDIGRIRATDKANSKVKSTFPD